MQDNKGNALFLILIAVALFAALSYAVTQSGRGGGTIDKETAILKAAGLIQMVGEIQTAYQRLRILGENPVRFCSVQGTYLCNRDGATFIYASCSSGADCLWAPEGGDLEFPDLGFLGFSGYDASSFRFSDSESTNAVSGVGSGASDIFFWVWIGGSAESLSVCQEINKKLGLSTIIEQEPSPIIFANGLSVAGEFTYCSQAYSSNIYQLVHVLEAQ